MREFGYTSEKETGGVFYIWSVELEAAEPWALRKENERWLEAFEM